MIKESRFPSLTLREVWAWENNPIPLMIRLTDGSLEQRIFYLTNLQDPQQGGPLGFSTNDLEWGDDTTEEPLVIHAATWLNPQWVGL